MTSSRFVKLSLGLVILGALCIAGLSYELNLYGQFGNVRGKSYRAYYPHGRVSKYLMAHNYVPSNFDSLLIGSSIAANWDTRGFEKYRMYNLSISGGNATEEKVLLETVLKRGQIGLVIFVVNPYLTSSHGLKSQHMIPSQYWGSLGSPRLIVGHLSKISVESGFVPDWYDDFGCQELPAATPQYVATIMGLAVEQKLPNVIKGQECRIDPAGMEDFREMIEMTIRHGAEILLVHPPMYRKRYEVLEADYAEYRRVIDSQLPPSALILDCNTSKYNSIRDELANYNDHTHFSKIGAEKTLKAVDEFLHAHKKSGETLDK